MSKRSVIVRAPPAGISNQELVPFTRRAIEGLASRFLNRKASRVQGQAVAFFAGHGFAVVVQDARGKYESEGEYVLNRGYRDDAFDTIEWITAQPWSNGKVGTYGCSYQGENQLIIISPTNHCASESVGEDYRLGELELGDARFGHFALYLDWFSQWLNGEDRGVTEWPKVQYYMIGRNEWRASDRWPPSGVEMEKLYFHSDGEANSHFGDGTLSRTPPKKEPADRLTYDPANPVMSAGGPYSAGVGSAPYMDQRPTSARTDVLVYTSAPFGDGLELEGPIDAVLYISSSVKDTDFSVKLVDVAPDGTAINVQVGFLRARYREGRDKQVFMEPGEVYRVPVSLNDIAYYFEPGHRLRVQVTSSDFPSFDRNLNTGGPNYNETEWITADNVIHHSGEHASYIVLPVSR
jgi:putative CocE/NonD family hydrolase